MFDIILYTYSALAYFSPEHQENNQLSSGFLSVSQTRKKHDTLLDASVSQFSPMGQINSFTVLFYPKITPKKVI